MKKYFLTLAAIGLMIFPLAAGAQGIKDALDTLQGAVGTQKTGLSADLTGSISTIVRAALVLVGTIFLLLTIYAGILWMTARGEEEHIEKATKIIKASVIGLFITMAAYAITYFVTNRLSSVATAPPNYPSCESQNGICQTAAVCGTKPLVPYTAPCAGSSQVCCSK